MSNSHFSKKTIAKIQAAATDTERHRPDQLSVKKKWWQQLRGWAWDAIAQIYPNLCLSCSERAIHVNGILCLKCYLNLPETKFHLHRQNEFTERLWGRVPIETAAALYKYDTHQKEGGIKRLLHRLKYERHPEIAVELGKYYGRQLKDSPHYQSLDGIVPVPLHPRKQRMRGYNQSIEFAKGLSVSLGIPCYNRGLIRTTFTQTQTRKNRFERLDNVSEVFKLGRSQKLAGKHLLLVDDVLTTGATLEACGQVLLKLPAVKLSMLTLAIAVH